jgi:hypothetical protein
LSPSDYLDACDDLNRRRDRIQARARRHAFLLKVWSYPAAVLLSVMGLTSWSEKLLTYALVKARAIEQRRKDDLLELLKLHKALSVHKLLGLYRMG